MLAILPVSPTGRRLRNRSPLLVSLYVALLIGDPVENVLRALDRKAEARLRCNPSLAARRGLRLFGTASPSAATPCTTPSATS